MKMTKLKIFSAHFFTILFWGSAFPGIRHALSAYSPEHLSLLRLLIGSSILLIVSLFVKTPIPRLKDLPVIMLLGFLAFTVYHIGLNIGEQTVSAGIASLLVSMTPIFTAILAFAFHKVKLPIHGWFGALVSFIGVIVITIGGGNGGTALHIGIMFILIASIAECFYFVFQNRYLERYGFFPFTMYTIWAGTISMLIFSPGLFAEIAKAPFDATLTVVYLGIFPTVVPYFALAYVTSKTGATEATSSLYLTPAISYFIAWIFLGETPSIYQIGGSMIVLTGVFITNIKTVKRKKGKLTSIAEI
ncbi:DMT family transporter [Aciduricibacillus chroicocephali]|uniref:DMT family transporter n=1 Tax=Aciduricibacillus chroicocephali TaxID=3054939 RepID=A0ABY9KVZ1_9BACI|nr:DMT family transporter [Bacillaceae bacterium 44XB]